MRRMLKGLGWLLLVVVLLVALLPAFVSMDGVRRAVLARINARAPGVLDIERWSFGWWRGVRLDGVRYTDKAGRYGYSVASVSMSGGLLRLALNPAKKLGNVVVASPHAWCDLGALEKAGPPAEAPSSGGRVPLLLTDLALTLAVRDGQVEIRKPGQSAVVVALGADLVCTSLRAPLRFTLQADPARSVSPAVAASPALRVSGELTVLPGGIFKPVALTGEVTVQAREFNLVSLALARAYVPDLPLAEGTLNADLAATLAGGQPVRVAGGMELRNLRLSGGALGADRVAAESVRLDADIVSEGQDLVVRRVALTSPLAVIKAAGRLTPVAGARYPRGQLAVLGDVKLAPLAAQLPATLRLRPDVRVQGGDLHVDARVRTEGDSLRTEAHATLKDLRGRRGDASLQLSAPVDTSATVALSPAGVVVESFSLKSGFATASGAGSATGLAVRVSADLAAALREAGQLVDLGALQVAGQLRAELNVGSTGATAGPSSAARTVALRMQAESVVLAGLTPAPMRTERFEVAGSAVLLPASGSRVAGMRDVAISCRGLPLDLTGGVARVDLADPGARSPLRLAGGSVAATGTLESVARFCRDAGLARQDLPLTGPARFAARFAGDEERLQIDALDVDAGALALQASGTLDSLSGARLLALRGTLASDCAVLAGLVQAFTGYRPDITGAARRPFALRLPLSAGSGVAMLRQTEAEAAIHAERFHSFGVTATAIDLGLRIGDERARLSLATTANGGQVRAEPCLDLAATPVALVLPAHSVLLRDVQLNRELCDELLARIHPVFRGCGIVGGTVGLTMDNLHAPLGSRLEQDTVFAGSLSLTNVVLRPAGLLAELLRQLRVSADETRVPAQTIRFECRNGRIVTTPLVLMADRAQLIFSGSVGLDHTLAYTAEVPLTEALVGANAYPLVKGATVRVPITGTVSAPRLDMHGLVRAVAEVAAKVAANALIEDVRKGGVEGGRKLLEDILRGQKPKPPPAP